MKFLAPLEIPEPTQDNHAATRKTVDDKPDVPPGGNPMQVVVKSTANDFDVEWHDTAVAPGGTTDQLLAKASGTDFATKWINAPTAASDPLKADKTTTINTTAPLAGGGNLSANRTLTVAQFGSAAVGVVPASGGGTTNFLRADGSWSPIVAAVASPLIIPDPVGAPLPTLIFSPGDGDGVTASSRQMKINMANSTLQVIDDTWSKVGISVLVPSATKAELGIGGLWTLQTDSDGWLRFFHGTDRAATELAVHSNGTLNVGSNLVVPGTAGITGALTVSGGVFSPWYTETPILQPGGSQALVLRSTAYVEVQAAGSLGAPTVGISCGNQYGIGTGPTTSLYAQPNGNNYYQRPVTVNKTGGGGEVGIGLANHNTGWTAAFQVSNDGSIYIGCLNGANTAYVKSYASQFTSPSSQRFKADIERMDEPTVGVQKVVPNSKEAAPSAMDAIRQVAPVNYRCLQHEMALAPECMTPNEDGTTREAVEIVPEYRFGIIAEELQVVAPDAIKETPHGPALDLSGMVAILWQAVRELTAKVDELSGAVT